MSCIKLQHARLIQKKKKAASSTKHFLIISICSHPIQTFLGASRGFAFVTFTSIDDAKCWIEKKQVEQWDPTTTTTSPIGSQSLMLKKD